MRHSVFALVCPAAKTGVAKRESRDTHSIVKLFIFLFVYLFPLKTGAMSPS